MRDPYGRLLSAFTDKVVRKRKQARPFYHWLGRVDPGPPAFIDFLRFLGDGGALSDAHWAPQADLMLLPMARFDFVGRLERLEADLTFVVDRVFAPQAPLEMRRAGPRTDSHRRLAGAYTPEGLEIVNRVYAADFETFGVSDAHGLIGPRLFARGQNGIPLIKNDNVWAANLISRLVNASLGTRS